MRRITLGVLSFVSAAAFVACGDDDGGTTPNTGGRAGNAGNAGTSNAGNGGAAGDGGSAGTSNNAGNGGSAGSTGAPEATCTGCVQLTVEIPAAALPAYAFGPQVQYYFDNPAANPAWDLTDVQSITWRVQSLTSTAGHFVQPIVSNAPPEDPTYGLGYYNAPQVQLSTIVGAFTDVTLNVAMIPGPGEGDAGPAAADAGDAGAAPLTAFDKTKVRRISLTIGAPATPTAGIASVQVDSVTFLPAGGPITDKTFNAGVDGLTLNNYQMLTGALPPAAN
jgi:hypothetical protein